MMRAIERLWDGLVEDAARVMFVCILIGLVLLVFSYALGVHDVTFTGKLSDGTEILGPNAESITPKQVGFAWAPNWALTGAFLLPLAIYNTLLARGEIEPLIRRLVKHRMLVSQDFEQVDAEMVVAEWRRESSRWTLLTTVAFLIAFSFVLFFDFIPVVAWWLLADPEQVAAFVKAEQIDLHHNVYEFDWSIAASFENAPVTKWPNLIFSSVAYLAIGMIGPGFLLAIFIWFVSICSFFSAPRMRRLGLRLIPRLESDDERLGFENFEIFFHHLAMASIFTAALAVAMHLQNVFLRAPDEHNIYDMVFGNTFAAFQKIINKGEFDELTNVLTSMSTVLDVSTSEIGPQTFSAAVVLFLVTVIVFFCLWTWLRHLAKKGKFILREEGNLSEEQRDRLDEMVIWPVGWISLNILIAVAIIVAMSMWFVNFVSLVLVFFIARAGKEIVDYVISLFRPNKTQRKRRK